MNKTQIVALILGISVSSTVFAEWEALPDKAPAPANNPTTEAKIQLGRTLFFDPRLSSTGTVSCNSCHNVMLGGDDNRAVSMGIHGKTGGRSAPTVWNSAFNASQFWDGRAGSLEEQALGPITNPIEMGLPDIDAALTRLRAIPGYENMFASAFGQKNAITSENLAKAIAAYERTLITPNSPYDRFVQGDTTAMSEQQLRGMNTFAEVGCAACHSGPAFSGPTAAAGGFFMKFPTFAEHDLVTKYDFMSDKGRFEATKKDGDQHFWKVPTLRNVAMTAPYFHNGKVQTLDEAVRVMGKVQLNTELKEGQVNDLVAFLTSLSGPFPKQAMPNLPGTAGLSLTK
ncbi:MAG: cytochrome-c peroxidase [Gammaproteobacteria bacterium]|nr:cytochrome-c peroxidase [Gammaproteobacteria bacterium]